MDKARMAIYAMAGLYLMYLAFKMFGGLSESTGVNHVLTVIFMIGFAVAGIAMVALGIYKGYKLNRKKTEND